MGYGDPLLVLGTEHIETFLDMSLRFTSFHGTPGIITYIFLMEVLVVETMLTRSRSLSRFRPL